MDYITIERRVATDKSSTYLTWLSIITH
jgi:hypothetical protein